MVTVYFTQSDGKLVAVEAAAGVSLMEAAAREGIKGVDALCGGSCICGTCHVYVAESWLERVGDRGAEEDLLLNDSVHHRNCSRLSCQIELHEGLDGLEIEVAPQDA